MKIKIGIDALGSDNFPVPEVRFLKLNSAIFSEVEIILVGDEELLRKTLIKENIPESLVRIVHASERIGMDEPPTVVKWRRDSSIMKGLELLREGEIDAFVSAGNTGAVMAGSLIALGRISDISRPAIGGFVPTRTGFSFVIDLGANVDCKPEHLFDFAIMGNCIFKLMMGKENPTTGILSIGEEEIKGNELVKKTKELIKSSPLNFIGNVEGREVFLGKADVIVCDGFVGNVFLKGCEGIADFIKDSLKEEIEKKLLRKIFALFLRKSFENLKKKFDYAEYGGVPLAGVKGNVIITHGRASAEAILSAVKVAKKLSEKKFPFFLEEEIKKVKKI